MKRIKTVMICVFAVAAVLGLRAAAAHSKVAPEKRTETYAGLAADGQAVYCALEDALASKTGFAVCPIGGFYPLPALDAQWRQLQSDALDAYRCDHPEEIRLSGVACVNLPLLNWAVVWPCHSNALTDAQADQGLAAAEQLCQSLEGLSQDRQVEELYRHLTSTVTYCAQDDGDHTLYGALVEQEACCQGVAGTMAWCLTRLGVPNQTVLATMPSGAGHAWNRVQLDGEWYELDATWDLGRTEENWLYYLGQQLHPDAAVFSGKEAA